ncbi:MAG: CvpA family protein [Paludibacteraceae bacterium]|nr:CvpA family protein [Paludibacteraceae bacterium]
MNWLDVIIVLPLLAGLIRGLMRGLVSEVIAILVVILGVLGSRMAAPTCSAWLLAQFAWPKEICDVVAYVVLFLAIGIALSLCAKLLSRFLRAIHLSWANRLLGGLFGICKYGILVLVVVFAMDRINHRFHWLDNAPVVQTSVLYPYMVKACAIIYQSVPTSESGNAPSAKP